MISEQLVAKTESPSATNSAQLLEAKFSGLRESIDVEHQIYEDKLKTLSETQSQLAEHASQLNKDVRRLTDELESNSILERLDLLEAKSQTVIDLADDIVGSASNQITQMQTHADSVISQAEVMLTWYLGVLTIGIAIAFFVIQWAIETRKQRSENEILRSAAQKLSNELKTNVEFSRTFVTMLSENDALSKNINHAIKTVADEFKQELTTTEDDELRDEIADAIDDEPKQSNHNSKNKFKAVWKFFDKGQEI